MTTRKMNGSPGTEVLGLLGLARRAGAVVSGTEAARNAIRQGEARLVFMAEDAADQQLEKVRRTLVNRPIPQAILGDRAILGAAVGRGPVSVVAVTGASFAKQMRRLLDLTGDGVTGEAEE